MFGSGMLSLLLILLVVSVIARENALFLLALALLAAAGLSRLWERYCLDRITYRRRFSQPRAAYGESVELEIEVVNRKPLPLSWLEVEDEISTEFKPLQGRLYHSHKPHRALLTNLLAFRPYELVRRRYTFPCLTRGEHVFGPVRLRSGDLFGFATREELREQTETFVVYPRVVPVEQLGLPARHPIGDLRTQSWLFEDVSRIAGAREYRPGDGLRRIHWPASVRTQRLQAKVYEATTSHNLAIFLNLATDDDSWWGLRYDPDVVELGIVTAASLASWGLEQGYEVGLYTNGMHRGTWGNVAVQSGRDPSQLERILVALGRLQPFAVGRFDELLPREARRLPFGATVVLVVSALTPTIAQAALALRARGHAVTAILTGRQGVGASLAGVTVLRVGPPEVWREASALSLAAAGPAPRAGQREPEDHAGGNGAGSLPLAGVGRQSHPEVRADG